MRARRALPFAAGALTAWASCGSPEPVVTEPHPPAEVAQAAVAGRDGAAGEVELQGEAGPSPAVVSPEAWFQDVRWTRRLLVLSGPADQVAAQLETLRADEAALLERDLLVIDASAERSRVVVGDRADAPPGAFLRARYDLDRDGVQAVLIGLDGGLKVRRQGRFEPLEILRAIDAMPMRRAELRERGR